MHESIIYSEAIRKWGENAQIDVMIEEAAELIVSLQHRKRGRGSVAEILSEMADVDIMLGQMRVIFGSYGVEKAYKLARVQERLMSNNRDLASTVVHKAIREVFDVDPNMDDISEDTTFNSLGMDDYDFVEIVILVEEDLELRGNESLLPDIGIPDGNTTIGVFIDMVVDDLNRLDEARQK